MVSAEVNGSPEETTLGSGEKPGWWRRWVVNPVVGQLKQGISADKLGWTIGVGVTLGIFPILGTRAWLCLLAGWAFKLNQPVLHSFKSLVYPLHLVLMIPFIQMGQWLFGREPLRISMGMLKDEIAGGAMHFWQEFGWVILRAATAWLLVAPVILLVLKWAVTPVLRKLGKMKESAANE